MDLIERYLYQVEKYLPRSTKTEIINELRSLILEQLDDQQVVLTDEDSIALVLKDFGDPRIVAASYTKQEGIIMKELIPVFYFVLRILLYAVPITFFFITLIDYFSSHEQYTITGLLLFIVYSLPGIISAVLTSIGILFLIFLGISRSIDKSDLEHIPYPEFDPKKLPAIPTNIHKAPLFESIFSILGSILFLYVFNYQQGLIAIYYDNVRYPLLNEQFDAILLFINMGVFFQIVISTIHLYLRQKTFITKTLEYIHTLYSAVILFLLATSDIFNDAIIDGYDLSIVPRIFTIMMIIAGIATIIGGTVQFIKMFVFIKRDQV